jgi:3-oxoacyl-[acyl-carrier protein] reductase
LLKNKTVLVTGANRGIGRAIVEEFAQAGANLVVHCRERTVTFSEDMRELANQCGVVIDTVTFDLTDTSAMKAAINQTFPHGRAIDVLVNNAGVAHGGLFLLTPVASVRSVFDINFFAQLELTQLIARKMLRQKSGVIINMGSIAGLDLVAGNVAYGVSKAALMAFTQTLAAEVGTLGLRVNAVAPGLVDTLMAEQMEKKAEIHMIASSAMKRMGTVQEIAKVVLFLASDAAKFINGQVITVNGGRA